MLSAISADNYYWPTGWRLSVKKLSLFALVLSSFSFATSIRPISLESIDTPLFLNQHDEAAKIIRVAYDGEVFGGTCAMKHGKIDYSDCDWQTVKTLTRYEIREVANLVKDAKKGTIQHPKPGQIHCLAIPTHHLSMKADNGSTLLKAGAYPCGLSTYNTSNAAQELVGKLNKLRSEYNQLVD